MQFNSSMDVSTLRNCNPDREHLFATEGSISIEKGGVKEVYGWEQNRWTNPCGWCSVPNWDVLVAKNDELVNLKNSFSNLYNREFSTIKNKKQIQEIEDIKSIVLNQLKEALLGKVHCLQSKDATLFNTSLNYIIKSLNDDYKLKRDIAEQIVQIRQDLSQFGISTNDLDRLVEAYFERRTEKITARELSNLFANLTKKYDVSVEGYLNELMIKCEEKITPYNWGVLIPPVDPRTSKYIKDWSILFTRISKYFPSENELLSKANKGQSVEIPRFDGDLNDIISMCHELMELSSLIANAVHDDLKQWGRERGLDKMGMAMLLKQQTGWGRDGGGSTYLQPTFFDLPLAYHAVAALANPSRQWPNQNLAILPENWLELFHEKGTDQSQWLEIYNTHRLQIFELVGYENLRKADDRYVKWMHEHNVETRMVKYPTTMPT